MRNTVEKVSCEHGHERNRKELEEQVPLVVGSRIRNALERAQQELHGQTPSKLRESSRESTIRRFASTICSSHTRFPCPRGGRAMRPRLRSAIACRATSATADLSRWTHRVGVMGSARQTPPPRRAERVSTSTIDRGICWHKTPVLTRGASSSPLQGEGTISALRKSLVTAFLTAWPRDRGPAAATSARSPSTGCWRRAPPWGPGSPCSWPSAPPGSSRESNRRPSPARRR